jgi:hypothetical protein
MTAQSIQIATRAKVLSENDFVEYLDETISAIRAEARAELEAENKRLREALECIASFSYTASSIGGDDRINKLRGIARAALGKE